MTLYVKFVVQCAHRNHWRSRKHMSSQHLQNKCGTIPISVRPCVWSFLMSLFCRATVRRSPFTDVVPCCLALTLCGQSAADRNTIRPYLANSGHMRTSPFLTHAYLAGLVLRGYFTSPDQQRTASANRLSVAYQRLVLIWRPFW